LKLDLFSVEITFDSRPRYLPMDFSAAGACELRYFNYYEPTLTKTIKAPAELLQIAKCQAQ
jgi:hypothetical protein